MVLRHKPGATEGARALVMEDYLGLDVDKFFSLSFPSEAGSFFCTRECKQLEATSLRSCRSSCLVPWQEPAKGPFRMVMQTVEAASSDARWQDDARCLMTPYQ